MQCGRQSFTWHCPPQDRQSGRSVPWLSACRATTVRWLQHEFALGATDPEVLEEIEVMIAELERRACELGDGDAGEC